MQFRASWPAGHVMVFHFPKSHTWTYHARNVLFPLDLVLVNCTGRVVSIERLNPGRWSRKNPAHLLAIEAPAGFAQMNSLKIGDRIEFL